MQVRYDEEYLCIPDALDLKIVKLHKEHHGVNGIFVSLDCMHTPWKNCPKHGRHHSKAGKKRAVQPRCLKHCQIIIYGSGMHPSAMLGC
jgi:hypothetical protein